jgi:hypothetical protein
MFDLSILVHRAHGETGGRPGTNHVTHRRAPENSRCRDPVPRPCATLSSLTQQALLHSVEGVAGPLHTCRQAKHFIDINRLSISETSFRKSGRCSPADASSAYSPVKQGFINWHNDCCSFSCKDVTGNRIFIGSTVSGCK